MQAAPSPRFACTTTGMSGFYGLWVGEGDEVLACGLGGLFARSADGGQTWSRQSVDGKRWSFGGCARLPGGPLLLACGGGRIAESADDGASWQVVQLGHKSPMHQIAAAKDFTIVSGCDRLAWRRGDGIWHEARLPKGSSSRGACIDAVGRGFVSSTSGFVSCLEVGASTWTPTVPRAETRQGLHGLMVAGDEVVVVGDAGFVAFKNDGVAWCSPSPTVADNLTAGALFGKTLLVGTPRGAVLRSDDRGTTWTTVLHAGSGPCRVHRLVARDDGLCLVVSEEGVFRAVLSQ